jgi:hypothetical protein
MEVGLIPGLGKCRQLLHGSVQGLEAETHTFTYSDTPSFPCLPHEIGGWRRSSALGFLSSFNKIVLTHRPLAEVGSIVYVLTYNIKKSYHVLRWVVVIIFILCSLHKVHKWMHNRDVIFASSFVCFVWKLYKRFWLNLELVSALKVFIWISQIEIPLYMDLKSNYWFS